jgi:predicted nuclease with TOPRIM domain
MEERTHNSDTYDDMVKRLKNLRANNGRLERERDALALEVERLKGCLATLEANAMEALNRAGIT